MLAVAGFVLMLALLPTQPVAADHGYTAHECSIRRSSQNWTQAEFDECVAHAQQDQGAGSSKAVDTDCTERPLTRENCDIMKYIIDITNVVSGLVGVVIVIMITWGGIRYITARNDPQQVNDAKRHIYNAIIALVLYIFTFAFLQWVVPGGLF